MAEISYTATQVARQLGVSTAMLRRYARSYEEATGEPIAQDPREGRRYTQAQLDTLVLARGFVRENAGLSVDQAMRLALGNNDTPAPELAPLPGVADPQAFIAALRETITQPLLEELRELRAEVAALREERQALEPPKTDEADRVAELERRNKYLQGELERRDKEAEQRRPWWRWWRR